MHVAKHRSEAKQVNAEIVAVMRNALRQVRNGRCGGALDCQHCSMNILLLLMRNLSAVVILKTKTCRFADPGGILHASARRRPQVHHDLHLPRGCPPVVHSRPRVPDVRRLAYGIPPPLEHTVEY